MNFPRRIVNVVAAIALLSPALGGCIVISEGASDFPLEGFTLSQQRDFVESLAQIRKIAGVREVSWAPTPNSLWESSATIEVGVSDAFAEEQVSAVAATMDRQHADGADSGLPVMYSIRLAGDDAGEFTVSGLGLPPEIVVHNFQYWREVREAMDYGLTMHLLVTNRGDGDYLRVLSAPTNGHPLEPVLHFVENYDALAALAPFEGKPGDAFSVDGSNDFEIWSLPGLQASGSLPPSEILDLLDGISRFFPLRTTRWLTADSGNDATYFEGAMIWWTDDDTAQQGREVEVFSREYREEDWPAIVAAAARTSQLTGLGFRYITFERDFHFHTSACDGTIEQTVEDQALFDAVQASGVTLLEGASPGQCIPDFY